MPRRQRATEIPTHTWELPERQWEEPERESSSEDPDNDEEPEAEASAEECGEIFVQFVMSMYFSGGLSAKNACTLCWWAGKAGARGPVSEYGFRPNAPTRHYARHIDLVEKIDVRAMREQMLALPVPRYTNYDTGRSFCSQFALPTKRFLQKLRPIRGSFKPPGRNPGRHPTGGIPLSSIGGPRRLSCHARCMSTGSRPRGATVSSAFGATT